MTTTRKTAPISAEDAPMPSRSRARTLLADLLMRQETTLVFVVIVIAILASSRNATFLTSSNLDQILRDSVIYFVMACGAAILIIGGGLDFSVGAIFTLGALIASLLLVHGWNWPIAVLIGLAAGAAAGVVNYLIVTFWHVPPIIATLGTFFVLTGINNLISGGNDVLPLPDGFQELGQGSALAVANVIWYAIIVGVAFWFLLERTRFGVNTRAVGGNRPASLANGLRVRRVDLALYIIAGLTAALAGIIYSARIGAGQVTAGGSITTLQVITAVLIGGVSLLGGLGSITGVAIGAVLLSVINNALVIALIPPQYNNIVVGAILISAVAVDYLRRERLYRKR